MSKIIFNPEELFDEITFIDLKEAIFEYFSKSEVEQLVKQCFENLNKIGFNISMAQLTAIEIRETKKIVAGIKPIGHLQYKLVISKAALRKDKSDFLLITLYHELCHLIQFNYLFNLDLITYSDRIIFDDKDKDKVYNLLQINGGHTALWLTIAGKVNKNIPLVIPVVPTLNEQQLADLFLESIFKQDKKLSIDPETVFGDSIL